MKKREEAAMTAANDHPTEHGKFHVVVIYNGVDKKIEAQPTEAVRRLLDQAIQAFGLAQNTHLLGLFTETGQELSDSQSLVDAGVKSGARLLLRPSAVRGG
jgi:hypothetical protein